MRGRGLILVALLAAIGCEPQDQSAPTSFSDGVRVINSNMRGMWDAPGGPRCRWWIVKDGVVTNNGNTQGPATRRTQKPGPAADQSQTAIIGSGVVGHTFRSDKCGGWTRK